MILTKPQAEAVFSAMCALSNVGGFLDCRVGLVKIRFESARFITVNAIDKIEDYDGITAFATAYGLV